MTKIAVIWRSFNHRLVSKSQLGDVDAVSCIDHYYCYYTVSKNDAVFNLCNSYLSVFVAIFPTEPGLASFIQAKDGGSGGHSWSYETCKIPVKSSATNQHPAFYRPDALSVTKPTMSKHLKAVLNVFFSLHHLNCLYLMNTKWYLL